jgi:hypothetical protein
MNTRKTLITLGLMLASVIILPGSRADEYDQATKLTFNQSVQIPGHVLPPGTYWFVLADNTASHNIVQVFNSDRSTLYGTFYTIPTQRTTYADNTTVAFAESEPMQPQTIVSWFYPGNGSGHQFIYSKVQERELAQAKQYTVVAMAPHKAQNGASGY